MALAHIQKSINQNEYVMLDTREMVVHDIQELTDELIHRGLINKVKIWPINFHDKQPKTNRVLGKTKRTHLYAIVSLI